MEKFKIFYSWQSDLPNNKTKSFIRSCIDEAIDLALDSEAIEAERDEATLNTTGAPDIVSTLFSKIDESDLFVADISLCYTEDKEKKKKAPNPNVMLELGYAASKLGWDRIVCLCNTDYGADYPFDIGHNRITGYSLNEKDRSFELNRIAKIIFRNIRDLRGKTRVKPGVATHILGTYDFKTRIVERVLAPIRIGESESYILHNQELRQESLQLVQKINELTKTIEENSRKTLHKDKDVATDTSPKKQAISEMATSYIMDERPAIIHDIGGVKKRLYDQLDIEVGDDFFDCCNLKIRAPLFGDYPIIIGTDHEKEKYNSINKLISNLLDLEIRNQYLNTFDGMCFIPLAIQNISSVNDQDLHVTVRVIEGKIIEPDETLICDELEDAVGLICRKHDEHGIGLIDELFVLTEDGTIHVEPDENDSYPGIPQIPMINSNGMEYPTNYSEDYKMELREYIALSYGRNYYEFSVKQLRPNECRWLSQGMLIKPRQGIIKIEYQIHSSHSTGDTDCLELKEDSCNNG